MIILVIIFGLACFGYGRYYEDTREECPRRIRGYNCHASRHYLYPNGCDHSRREVLKAKLDTLPADDINFTP